MSIKKKYLNDNRNCEVTFILPKEIGKNAKRAQVLGEFNRWIHSATPMKKLNNGTFVATIELPIGREYQFRYLLDNNIWINDSNADRFVPSPFGDSENCVLTTYNDTHLELIRANQLKPEPSKSNIQPVAESAVEKSLPAENLLSLISNKFKNLIRFFSKPSLALRS